MRCVLTLLSCLILATAAHGQFGRSESACDTVVFEHSYTRCIKNLMGRTVAFGNRNATGQRHGWWCDLNGDPENRSEGEYVNDKRVGTWWMSRGEFAEYDLNGNIVALGSGCRDCPGF